ncbi:MAG: hypothetical protein O9284_12170 [Steroidobacteraceae bacterium]|nr:hypothetical protein [Steroidobacteraceae bacterium]
MDRAWLPFMELLIVVAFALGWLVLEWNGRRLDRQQAEREAARRAREGAADAGDEGAGAAGPHAGTSARDARHPEGQ